MEIKRAFIKNLAFSLQPSRASARDGRRPSAVGCIRNRKGYMRLIEVSLAAVLIFGFLIFVQQGHSPFVKSAQDYDAVILKTLGQGAIRSLDLRDNDKNFTSDLRDLVLSGNWAVLEREIGAALPQNTGFTLYTVGVDGSSTYRAGVATGAQPTSKEIVTVSYIVAGTNGNYCTAVWNECGIKLALWFKQ